MTADKPKKKRGHSVFIRIMVPCLLFVVLQLAIIFVMFYGTGVINEARETYLEAADSRTESRKVSLEYEMANRWSEVDGIVNSLNSIYEQSLNSYMLDDGLFSDYFLSNALDTIISSFGQNSINAARLVLVDGLEGKDLFYGLGLRTDVPRFLSSKTLYVGVASPALRTRLMGIATYAPESQLYFNLPRTDPNSDFFYKPYDAALDGGGTDYREYAYWTSPRVLSSMGEVITYSFPLYSNGNMYGVLGCSVKVGELDALLPVETIGWNMLCKKEENGYYSTLAGAHAEYGYLFGGDTGMTLTPKTENGVSYYTTKSTQRKRDVVVISTELNIYISNSYYSDEVWTLNYAADESQLFAYANGLNFRVGLVAGVTASIGLLIALASSLIITLPIMRLPRDVQTLKTTPNAQIKRTHVREIDDILDSIEDMGASIRRNSEILANIVDLTDMSMCAFEVNTTMRTFSYTPRLADVSGREIYNTQLTYDQFVNRLRLLEDCEVEGDKGLYTYVDDYGTQRWLSVRADRTSSNIVGIIMDVTQQRKEVMRVEYERDHDVLTGILNRRAFFSKADKVLSEGESVLKNAAMIVIDIDNLKSFNDTHGHEYGDEYLINAARNLRSYIPLNNVLTGRMSGDEFTVFFYGYETKEALRFEIDGLRNYILERRYVIEGEQIAIRCSGGVAFCPEHGDSASELIRCADFALYEIKNSGKGAFGEYDPAKYIKQEYKAQNLSTLDRFINGNMVSYVFQPIVSARLGKVYGYEALMRPNDPSMGSPSEILSLARAQQRLGDIERMTWMNALDAVVRYEKQIAGRRIFINSLSNQVISEQDVELIELKYSKYLDRIVLEFTESDKLVEDYAEFKRKTIKRWKAKIAVDDYGAGYSSDGLLLMLNPNYVKIDMYIVRDVDKNPAKLKLMRNLVSYAEERHIRVIAEGVETAAELQTVIEAGVDYIQGFYLAPPAPVPTEMDAKQTREIKAMYSKHLATISKEREVEERVRREYEAEKIKENKKRVGKSIM